MKDITNKTQIFIDSTRATNQYRQITLTLTTRKRVKDWKLEITLDKPIAKPENILGCNVAYLGMDAGIHLYDIKPALIKEVKDRLQISWLSKRTPKVIEHRFYDTEDEGTEPPVEPEPEEVEFMYSARSWEGNSGASVDVLITSESRLDLETFSFKMYGVEIRGNEDDLWNAQVISQVNTDYWMRLEASSGDGPDENTYYFGFNTWNPNPQPTFEVVEDAPPIDPPPIDPPPIDPNKVNILFDTDFVNDVDDPGCLAIANILADQGECNILAITANADSVHNRIASTVNAINIYYGRPNIPIGVTKTRNLKKSQSAYSDLIWREFPNSYPEDSQVEDAVKVARRALAITPDNSVTYVSIGYLMNMYSLMISDPDEISPLSGMELIRSKVKCAVIMAGQYPHNGTEYNFSHQSGHVWQTQNVVDNWPTRMVFCGSEVGWTVYSGTGFQSTPRENPVRRCFEVTTGFNPPQNALQFGYRSWDQLTLLWAIRGDQQLWRRQTNGTNKVFSNGSSQWDSGANDPRHEYLIKNQPDSVYTALLDNTYKVPPKKSEPEPPIDPPPGTGKYNYAEALQKSFLFYEANISGEKPPWSRIEWRGDSATEDGQDVGKDLSGGFYDAGDHVKFNFPMAYSMTVLTWGSMEFINDYLDASQLGRAFKIIDYANDYLYRCVETGSANTLTRLYAQCGNGDLDHAYWGPPEQMTMQRPTYYLDRDKPGTDLAMEMAASLASYSMIAKSNSSQKMLGAARACFEFGNTYRGKYSDSIPEANPFYTSHSGYQDETIWGAIWLYKATNDDFYLNFAIRSHDPNAGGNFSWDNKNAANNLLLWNLTGDSVYHNAFRRWLENWLYGRGGITYTSGGLAWSAQWASLRHTANAAFLAAVYNKYLNYGDEEVHNFVTNQINYILGSNPRNSSYVCGLGNNPPVRPHHRSSSGTKRGSDPAPNDHILYGALVGGPKSPDDFDYQDVREDYIGNEVACDYNAGLTGCFAYLLGRYGGEPLTDEELNQLPGIST